jgi:DNA helicase-2/ATP-dependent DNA helicase PcrA
MKSIVETIQKEQDEVIRNMKNDLLMVQGVAGSGKTSIALHRAAYLLYPGQKTTLKAQNILIISPNTAFEEYISNVLPELGEENITSMVFEQLIKPAFEDRPLESKAKFLDKLMRLRHDWEGVREYILYKTSPVCKEDLDTFIETIPLKYIPLTDVRTSNGAFISKKYQREWLLKRKHIPLNIRLQQLKTHILDLSFGMERNRRAYSEEKNRFKQDFENRTRLDIFSLYESFMKEYFYIPWENRTVISYEDSMPLAYLYLKLFGCERYRDIKHVVIDEAQDYYPLQYEIFRLLFPNAKFTVLGDYLQTIEKPETMSLYQQIQVSLQKKNATLITLNKSFRCTSEILDFALSFLKKRPAVESFNRNGEVPSVFKAADRQALIQEIAEKASNWLKEGLESICLLTRSKADAYRLYEAIKGGLEVSMVNDSLPEGMKGLVVMPIYQSKGLEFDGVIICDADSEHYHDEDDRQLLYVASTRALHRLALMGIGEMSPLLP